MPGLMIAGDTSLFENADEYDFRDELVRHMLVTVERGPGKVLNVKGVQLKDLASFRGQSSRSIAMTTMTRLCSDRFSSGSGRGIRLSLPQPHSRICFALP